jgi:hypothetical protein
MKKQLKKNTSTCLLVGMAFIIKAMMFSASANAQIIYTDIVPDSTYTIPFFGTDTFNLDLNGDGTTDFLIQAARQRGRYPESPRPSYVGITPQGSNAFITTTLNTVKKLVLSDPISSGQAWHNTTFQYLKQHVAIFMNPPTNTGQWDSVVDGYIGLQLINGGQTYYGWVRMDVTVSTSSASMTIKDYAYNSIPNQPILAGQTSTTGIIENSFASSINLYPNPSAYHLTIDLESNIQKAEIAIIDVTGKIVYKANAIGKQKLEVNTSNFSEGIYLVRIQSTDFIETKKLVVKR